MTTARRAATLCTLLLAILAGAAVAQNPPQPAKRQRPHRSGLWVELAGGFASLRVSCSARNGTECDADDIVSTNGSGGLTRVGGVISDNVLLAWESALFSRETFIFAEGDTSVVAELESTGIAMLWYPSRTGLFLKGGVGVAQGRFTVPTGVAQTDTVQGTGISLTFGFGWDWSFARKYALTLNAAAFVTAIGDLALPSTRVDDVIGTMYLLTLSFTFR